MNNKDNEMKDEAIWKKLDEHTNRIDKLTTNQAALTAEVRALERGQKDITSALARIENKLDMAYDYQNKQKGATMFGAWVLGITLTLLTVVASIKDKFFGS